MLYALFLAEMLPYRLEFRSHIFGRTLLIDDDFSRLFAVELISVFCDIKRTTVIEIHETQVVVRIMELCYFH